MTIRLTSVETFEKVLEKLKQDTCFNEEDNNPFFKFCVPDIKDGLEDGNDEWYLDVEWHTDVAACKVSMVFRYHRRSDIPTDNEYLTEGEIEK